MALNCSPELNINSKTCVKRHSQIDRMKIFMKNGSLMKVESIAEYFCNTVDVH